MNQLRIGKIKGAKDSSKKSKPKAINTKLNKIGMNMKVIDSNNSFISIE